MRFRGFGFGERAGGSETLEVWIIKEDSIEPPNIRWTDLLEAETEEARQSLAGDLLKQGIKANVRTLIKIHKWLLSFCLTPEGSLNKGDGFTSQCLLIKIGFSDSRTGHLYLKSLVDSPLCRASDADAMEAMAFEKKQWDGLYILDILQGSGSQAVKLSCLYALQYKNIHALFPALYRDIVLPLLKHEDSRARVYAIDVVWTDPQAKVILEELRLNEKEDSVIKAIDDALYMNSAM